MGFSRYLSAARKWAEEAIERRSAHLHALAWGVPALFAAGALLGHRLDASELTGICGVGNADPGALLWLWTVPRLVATLAGLYLILAGFSAMCKERNSFRRRVRRGEAVIRLKDIRIPMVPQQGTDTSKLEKFMCKMALFSVLFLLPCLLSLLCDLHHLSVLLRWFPHTIGCKSRGGALSGACVRPALPPALPYLLGPTMGLTAGMATGLWMLSPKTLNSWKRWCCCGGGKENNRSGKTANGGAGSGTGMVSMHRPAGSSSEFGESGKHFKGFSRRVTSALPLALHHQHPHHRLLPPLALPPPCPSASSPRRPLLPRADPPPLPPPPPTAAPSSAAPARSLPSSVTTARHLQHYVPLSLLSGAGTNCAYGEVRGGGEPNYEKFHKSSFLAICIHLDILNLSNL